MEREARASPVQGEVAQMLHFGRRGCKNRQSLSQKSEIFASSLYTREPWALPRQCTETILYLTYIKNQSTLVSNHTSPVAIAPPQAHTGP